MRSLSIALLGAPRITVDGQPLAVDTRKATAVLAYMALSGSAHARAVLADLLWPDSDPERSRSALRRTLSTLRGALGEERLVSDRLTVSVDLDGAYFDVAEFRRVVSDPDAGIDALAAAVALHRGDLLAGFSLRDSVEFDDWQRGAQETVRRERAGALDRLIDALAREGRFDEAIASARQRLELDTLHEPTHRRLIDLYARAGRRGDALVQYRECVRELDRELGVAPLSETTDLYNVINGGEAPAPIPNVPAVPAGELALVGRDGELERLIAAYATAGERGSLVVIEGEAGVGKTRLAQEARAEIERRGGRVLAAHPHPGEQGLAYGVLAALLREAVALANGEIADALRGDAARLLPELGAPPPGSLDEPGARLRFLESIGQVIVGAFAQEAGAVWIDDLQWCDPASLEALAYLARRLEGRPLLLLGARRTDEPDPERIYARFAELGDRISLGRLARADVISLALQSGLEQPAAERVYRESEGLPLFVAELLAPGAQTHSGGVRAVFEARLDAVGETAAQVLSAAALVGRTFDADTLRFASGRSETEVAGALEELGARGLIRERDAAYDFGHERLREVAADRIGLARRRLLHRRIAQALSERRGDPAIVARHHEAAGDDAAAALAYADAGAHARNLSAALEAIAHFEAAIALGHPDSPALQETIGDLHVLRGAYGSALVSYAAAAAATELDAAAAGRLEHKLGGVHERRGEWELADRHYEDALTLGADDAAVRCDRSRVAWRRGELEQARALGFEALELAEAAGASAAAAQANNILGLLGCGREYLERSLELSSVLPHPGIHIAALNNLARDHAAAGDLTRAEELLTAALGECAGEGDLHHEAALRNNLADVLHRAGARDEAMAELKLAVTAFAAIGGEDELLYPGIWNLAEW